MFGETALLLRKMKTKKTALETEKRAWEAEKAHFENMQSFQSTIKLNIGGHKYTISLSTLRQFPDTMLGAMFSGRHTIIPDAEGCYFLNRDGTHFRYIRNLLQSPEGYYKVAMALPLSVQEELKRECDYYGLLDIMFPFVQFEPFQCAMANDELIQVTQNKDGLFCTHGHPLKVSRKCGCAEREHVAFNYTVREDEYDTCMYMFVIPNFKKAIEEHGGKIVAAQPHNPCKGSHHYCQ